MGNVIIRFHAVALALCTIVSAQVPGFSCVEPAEIHVLNLNQVRAQLNSGQDEFFLYKRLEDLTPISPKPGILAPDFQEKLQKHSDDARFLYLYGRSLIGKNTPDAIELLNRAIEAAPKLPWTYTALAEIHASRNFLDNAKLLADMRAYRAVCPANPDGFKYLNKVNDPAETAQLAGQLRPLLERSKDLTDGEYWSLLWAAEFRTARESEFDASRKRVATDLERLKARPEPWGLGQLRALGDGYKLIGDTENADKIENRINPDWEVDKTYQAWNEKHGT